jgi:ParB/RepB/Spo0J family partition protein
MQTDLPQQLTRLLSLEEVDEPAIPMRTSTNEEEHFNLVDSMRAVGQLQPILVKSVANRYEVVVGHRRLKAARYLRWPTILATIVDNNDDTNAMRLLQENSCREQPAPEDEGRYFQHLAQEKKLGIREIARWTNRSPYYVESRLQVLTYPADIRDHLANKTVGLGVAAALAEINDQSERRRLTAYAVESGANAKTAEAWAHHWRLNAAAVPAEAIAAEVMDRPIKYEEPLFPCFGCERAIKISHLHVTRFCQECYHDISNANQTTHLHQRPAERSATNQEGAIPSAAAIAPSPTNNAPPDQEPLA